MGVEKQQKKLYEKMTDPDLYQDKEKIKQVKKRLTIIELELAQSYERWEYLETIKKQSGVVQ